MSRQRRGDEADLDQVSGAVLTPVRWVVLLGILASVHLRFGLHHVNRTAVMAAAAAYAAVAAGLPRLYGRPFSRYALARLLLAADLLFSGAIFLFTDGIRSPYFGLWYLALIHVALVLGLRAGLGVAAAVAALVVASEQLRLGGHEVVWDINLALGKLPFLLLVTWSAGRLAQELREREAARREVEQRALKLEAEEQRRHQEMETARRIQAGLLPAAMPAPAGLTLASFSHPAREVGGDTYDLIELPDDRLLIAIADVSGKGVPAALLTAAVQQGIRQFAGPEPAAVLAGLNRVLLTNSPEQMFVTAACVVINPRDGSAAAAVAGHPPPLWWDHSHQRLEPVSGHGPMLGIRPEWVGADRAVAPLSRRRRDAVHRWGNGREDRPAGTASRTPR